MLVFSKICCGHWNIDVPENTNMIADKGDGEHVEIAHLQPGIYGSLVGPKFTELVLFSFTPGSICEPSDLTRSWYWFLSVNSFKLGMQFHADMLNRLFSQLSQLLLSLRFSVHLFNHEHDIQQCQYRSYLVKSDFMIRRPRTRLTVCIDGGRIYPFFSGHKFAIQINFVINSKK